MYSNFELEMGNSHAELRHGASLKCSIAALWIEIEGRIKLMKKTW